MELWLEYYMMKKKWCVHPIGLSNESLYDDCE